MQEIKYVTKRPRLPIPPGEEDAKQLLLTKYRGWKYEEEWRSWIRLDERDPLTGFYFYSFDGFVRLSEVIVGPLCDIRRTEIIEALRGYTKKISIIKARLAFKTFRIVRNLKGF